jgi:XTP/dITP diphosphohydrolase
MNNINNHATPEFEELLKIMHRLRQECPWDRKQTIHTLRKLTIEETYELADAISSEDWQGIKEELGDLLLHIVFYAELGMEKNAFTLQDLIQNLNEKLIRRHPHIYGDTRVENEEEVKKNWERIKINEGKKSVLSGVPQSLPALLKAQRIQEKVRSIGFDWDHVEQVWDKCLEEMNELREAVVSDKQEDIEDEFGDVLFALVNYSRFINVDPEAALAKANKKFSERFMWMENYASGQGMDMHNMNLEALDKIWDLAKQHTK